ncbi:MAG: hypothetical protein ACFFCD_10910 [Promethearchaeota archaeon]
MEKYFGGTSLIKILDFLLDLKERDKKMIPYHIAQKTGVHPYAVSRAVKRLVKKEILNEEKVGARTRIYWLNKKNPKVRILMMIKDIISVAPEDPTLIDQLDAILKLKASHK